MGGKVIMTEDIIRRRKRRGYTIVDNQPINNPDLKYEDIGLLVYILSKPDDWTIYKKELVSSHQNGRESVAGILSRLEANGYLQIIPQRSIKGRFSHNLYIFTDIAWEFVDEVGEAQHNGSLTMNGKPLTAKRIREPVNGNPTPTNTIYTNLEEEEKEEEGARENLFSDKADKCAGDIFDDEIKQSAFDNCPEDISSLEQEITVFRNYTGIELKGDARQKMYLKWRKDWGFSCQMIMKAAELMCQLARQPNLNYIEQILYGWKEQNIYTVEKADLSVKKFRDQKREQNGYKTTGKSRGEQQAFSEYELYIPP